MRVGSPEVRYRGQIFRVVQERHQFGDDVKTFERAQRAPGVRVIVLAEGKVLLTKEYRREQGGIDIRLPGGKVFDRLHDFEQVVDIGGDPLSAAERAAVRELREETGLVPTSLRFLYRSACGATVDWDLYYFLVDAFDCAAGGQALESGESIEPFWAERREAAAMCLDGRISEERSALVLLRYLQGEI